MHTFQSCRYLQVASGGHSYLSKKTGIFPVKIGMFLYYKTKTRRDIFEEKGVSEQSG